MGASRVIIVGGGEFSKSVLMELNSLGNKGFYLLGIVHDQASENRECSKCEFLGSLEELPGIIDKYKPERLILTLTEQRGTMPVNCLMNALLSKGIVITPGPEFLEELTGKLSIESITPSKLIFSDEFRPSALSQFVARIVSLVVAFVALAFLAPILALVAIAIKIESSGPPFFVQKRVGRNGRAFSLYKFRSMSGTSDNRSEWVCDNGDRITPLGRWLRKHRIDELPQLLNVIRGDMNIVGPRPHPESNLTMFSLVARNMNNYGDQVPYYSIRLRVRPGITGWAQVKYKYANGLDEEMEKLRYDLYYVKHYSFGMDLKIISKTISLVIFGEDGTTGDQKTIPRESNR